MAKHHYLCIPKKHIKDINSLTKEDIPMLEQMKEMAIKYLTETFKDEGVTKEQIKFGFHTYFNFSMFKYLCLIN